MRLLAGGKTHFSINQGLVCQLSLDELAVHAGDVGDAFVLGTNGFASTRVGAVAETELIHLGHHGLGTLRAFDTTLGEKCELRDLRRYEEHCGTVLTSRHTSTASDASCTVHCFVCINLADEYGVGVLGLTGADCGVTTRSLDFVECRAIYHAVLDDGECCRTPRFNGDDVAVFETTHIELTRGCARSRLTVGSTIDIE